MCKQHTERKHLKRKAKKKKPSKIYSSKRHQANVTIYALEMHRLKPRKSEQSNKTEVASNENERQNEDPTKREPNGIVYKHN